MAHLHFHRTVYKSGDTKAKARVEYITRTTANELQATQQIRYAHRADREDLVYTQSRNLPGWAQGSALAYFRAAEMQEWVGGNAFEEWKITLPRELNHAQNMVLMRDLVDLIAGDRLPITYAFHAPALLVGMGEQPHLHLLISGRQFDGIERPQAQHFKKYNRQHPERGGAPKDAALYHGRAVKAWRVTITDAINVHLEQAGESVRLHPDTLEDRELAREPEPKLRPSESQAYRETGTISATMEKVLRIRASRETNQVHETLNARTYWEQRKADLGILRDMPIPEQLAHIVAARSACRDQAERRPQVEHSVGVEVDDRALGDQTGEAWSPAIMLALAGEAYRQARVDAEQLWEDVEDAAMTRVLTRQGSDWLQAHGSRRECREESAATTLARLHQVLDGMSRDAEEVGAHVKIRLWDTAHDQGQGY